MPEDVSLFPSLPTLLLGKCGIFLLFLSREKKERSWLPFCALIAADEGCNQLCRSN